MPPQPPPFGSQQYWNTRFTSNSDPFEWLEAPTALDPYLTSALNDSTDERPEILHIGCGTSSLSYHLKTHVQDPSQIHNLDYSDVAVTLGRKREKDLDDKEESKTETIQTDKSLRSTHNQNLRSEEEPTPDALEKLPNPVPPETIPTEVPKKKYMRWSSADLLSPTSILSVCKPSSYSLILDKSTSDSIACADDLHISLPYAISTSSSGTSSSPPQQSKATDSIHPLHILAIHMALVTKPQARWIALSYSSDRFPFLRKGLGCGESGKGDRELHDDIDDIPRRIIEGGLPDPSTLWTLEARHEIEVAQQEPSNGGASIAHQPRVLHYVYVLQRTDVELFVR